MRIKIVLLVNVLLVILIALTACELNTPVQNVSDEDVGQAENSGASNNPDNAGDMNAGEEPQNAGNATSAEENTEADQPEEVDAADDFIPMPPGREPIEIPSSGDRLLEGYYYPAKVPNAPVVVLMHWAGGTMEDWKIIAPWLQNRLDEITLPEAGGEDYYDISWFTPMPEETSFAVVVFNFGNFGNSPFGGDRESWLWDAVGALNFASSLEGIDPNRISAIGASIGADAAVDACYLFNDADEVGTCIGVFALSPGNYLTETFSFQDAADHIDAAGFPVWCMAAVNDGGSPALCTGLEGEHAEGFILEGDDHGMNMLTRAQFFITPPLSAEFDTMMVFQEILEVTYGQPLNDFTIP